MRERQGSKEEERGIKRGRERERSKEAARK